LTANATPDPGAESLKALAVRLAAVAEGLDERSQAAVQLMAASGERLESAALGLGQHGRRQAQELADAVGVAVHEAARRGVAQAVDPCAQTLQHAAEQAAQVAHGLHAQAQALLHGQRLFVQRRSFCQAGTRVQVPGQVVQGEGQVVVVAALLVGMR
jgi:hypothetical protein